MLKEEDAIYFNSIKRSRSFKEIYLFKKDIDISELRFFSPNWIPSLGIIIGGITYNHNVVAFSISISFLKQRNKLPCIFYKSIIFFLFYMDFIFLLINSSIVCRPNDFGEVRIRN